MGGLLDNLGQLVLTHQAWSHWIIALGVIIQGEITVIVSVYLVLGGNLGFADFFLSALLGIIISDYLLYFLGRMLRGTRFGWRLYKRLKQNKRAQFYTYYVSQNLKKIIILSKFLIGTNFIAILAVGWTKVKFGKFVKSHILAALAWLSGVTLVSYFLAGGLYLLKAEKVFRQVEIGIIILVAILIGGELLLKRLLGRVLMFEVKAKDLGEKINAPFEENDPRVKSENAEEIFKQEEDDLSSPPK